MNEHDEISLDFEWDISTGAFRCCSWWLGGSCPVVGTTNFAVAKYRLGEIFHANPDIRIVAHNATADLTVMVKWGFSLPANFRVADSMIAARLRYPDVPTKALKPFAREFGYDWQEEWESDDLNKVLAYCARDTYACSKLRTAIVERMSSDQKALFDLNNKFVRAYWAMEVAAIKLDTEYLEDKVEELSIELSVALPTVPVGIVTDDGSFRTWLRTKYSAADLVDIPLTRETKDLQLSSKALSLLPHRVAGLDDIMAVRTQYDYLKNFVLNPLEKQSNGYYPARYNILLAKTHRRSTEPAIQNWPVSARRALVPRRAGGRFVAFDYKNLEARLFAWQCGSKEFLSHLIEGGYLLIAKKAFGWDDITDKKDPRYKLTKAVILAITYNMGDWLFRHNLKLEHGLDKTEDEIAAYRATFFTAYPEVYQEIERRKKYMHATGHAISVVGQGIQSLSDIPEEYIEPGKRRQRRNRLENKAVNNPTQMLASYITGSALVDVTRHLLEWNGMSFGQYIDAVYRSRTSWPVGLKGFASMEVHDELVFETRDEATAQELREFVEPIMTKPYTLLSVAPGFDCPLEVECGVSEFLTKI